MIIKRSQDPGVLRVCFKFSENLAVIGALITIPALVGIVVLSVNHIGGFHSRHMQWGALAIAGCFMCLGLGMILFRRGLIINRSENTLTTWWGFLFPAFRNDYSLDDIRHVALERQERTYKSSKYWVYAVRLAVSDATGGIKVEERREHGLARAHAEQLAKLLEVGLSDATSGDIVYREAGTLDESLHDRAERTGALAQVPEPPVNAQGRYSIDLDSVVYDIPPLGFTKELGVAILVPAIFIPGLLIAFVTGSRHGWVIASAVATTLMLVVAIWAIAVARRRTRIIASPRELRVETIGILRRSAKVMFSNEIEQLTVHLPGGDTPKAALLAQSDKTSLRFGEGLSVDELRWMQAVLTRVLSA